MTSPAEFPKVLATLNSLSNRSLICGVGVNDSIYTVRAIIDGKPEMHPIYRAWTNMMNRCYSDKFHLKNPSYKGCSVSKEWRVFSAFERWATPRYSEGMAIDKDILKSRNKIYSEDNCLFISASLNSLLVNQRKARGKFKIGVYWQRNAKKYHAQCNVDGEPVYLGLFTDKEEAHQTYLKFKSKVVHKEAQNHTGKLKQALIRISGEIARGEYYD